MIYKQSLKLQIFLLVISNMGFPLSMLGFDSLSAFCILVTGFLLRSGKLVVKSINKFCGKKSYECKQNLKNNGIGSGPSKGRRLWYIKRWKHSSQSIPKC